MKIVHVIESFGAGVLIELVNLVALQCQRGLRVTILHGRRPETPIDYQKLFPQQVRLIEIKFKRSLSPFNDIMAAIELYEWLRASQVDVVHLHSSKAGFLGRIVGKYFFRNLPVVYSPHGLAFLQTNLSIIQRQFYLMLEKFAANSKAITVACGAGELACIHTRIKDKSAILIENGIDTSKIPERIDSPELLVGTCGRIVFQKNTALFAKIARHFLGRNVRFIWIGGSDDDYKSQELRRELLAAGVQITGWLQHDKVLELVSGFTVYLQTSIWEGLPLSVIEAQACGVPAVVTNVIGNREVVVHGKTGFVENNEECLIQSVERLIADRELNLAMGLDARNAAFARFSMGRVEADYMRIYRRMCLR